MILNSNMCLQLIKGLLADPFHVHDFFRSGETAVGFAVSDDVFGSGGADAGECVEFFQSGGVQVHAFVFGLNRRDIRNSVHRSDFMKVNLCDRNAVSVAFCFCNQGIDCQNIRFYLLYV